jgi:hypothetical protein
MGHKDTPILKKQIQEMLSKLEAAERLSILEPLCEKYRNESRQNIEKDVREFKSKKGIPRIKTDY